MKGGRGGWREKQGATLGWWSIKGVKKGECGRQLGRQLSRQGRLWSRGGEGGLITGASQEGRLGLCVSRVPGDLACYKDGWMWRGCSKPVLGFGLSPCVPGLTSRATSGPPPAAVKEGLGEGGCVCGSWW